MKYFLHDSSAFDDEKITELFMAFGYEGLGLFYTVLEKLAKHEQPVKTAVLKKQLFVGKKLEKCWNFMEEIGILSSNNGETFNKQLLNFSGKYAIKSEKNKKRVSEWREKQALAENVTHYESVRNAHKDKVNKSKENVLPPYPLKGEPDFSTLNENGSQKKEKTPRRKFEPDLSILRDEASREIVSNFLDYRAKKGKPYKTQAGVDALIKKLRELAGGSFPRAKAILEQSIAAEWDGIFQLKNQANGKHEQTNEASNERAVRIAATAYANANGIGNDG